MLKIESAQNKEIHIAYILWDIITIEVNIFKPKFEVTSEKAVRYQKDNFYENNYQ